MQAEDILEGSEALMRYKCFHLIQESGGAVEDSVLLQEKSASIEFLKLC